MNRLICTTVLLAAVALAGCKREEHPARQRIAIATTIEPLTRAPQLDEEGSGRFADTDRLTLLVSDDAAQQSAQFGYTPQTTLYWSELGFAAPGTMLTFAALAAGTLTPAGTRQATFTESGREVRFLLVPQPTDGVSLELHVGADIRRISLGELAEGIDRIEGGRQLHVTLTVRNGRIEFGDAVIEGWEDQGSIEDEIIL